MTEEKEERCDGEQHARSSVARSKGKRGEQMWRLRVISRKGDILRAVEGNERGCWEAVGTDQPSRGGKVGCRRGSWSQDQVWRQCSD